MKNWIEQENGVRLFYRDWGNGPTILFVSSWALSSEGWGYPMHMLSQQGFRCVAFDRRGHGNSSDPGEGYDYDTLASDLHHVIERLKLEDVLIVGHSMGCGEVIHYLDRYGTKRVKGVILIGTTTPAMRLSAANPGAFPSDLLELNYQAMRDNLPRWVDDNVDAFFMPDTLPSMKDWVRQMLMRVSFNALCQCQRTNMDADFTAVLPKMDMPVLLIHGDKDVSQPIEAFAHRSAELFPNCRLEIYRDAPHGLIFTHAQRLLRDISEFHAEIMKRE
ncbi:MAG TPA: alpha/beta hydrolase [Rickettsiales bacterium]|nr:alpha/beta hydrolase [Rickettsiales bacterium]